MWPAARYTASIMGGRQNKFCSDQVNGGFRCNMEGYGPWENFTIVYLGNNQVGLIGGRDGKYCSDSPAPNNFVCNRDSRGSWETFTYVKVGEGQVALMSSRTNLYCSDDTTLVCNRASIGPCE
jgi:hypothetical protein